MREKQSIYLKSKYDYSMIYSSSITIHLKYIWGTFLCNYWYAWLIIINLNRSHMFFWMCVCNPPLCCVSVKSVRICQSGHAPVLLSSTAAWQLRSWGSQFELADTEFETHSLQTFFISKFTLGIFQTKTWNSCFLHLILKGLDLDKQASASTEQISQFDTFEELLEVVTCAVAKLNLDWPKERKWM